MSVCTACRRTFLSIDMSVHWNMTWRYLPTKIMKASNQTKDLWHLLVFREKLDTCYLFQVFLNAPFLRRRNFSRNLLDLCKLECQSHARDFSHQLPASCVLSPFESNKALAVQCRGVYIHSPNNWWIETKTGPPPQKKESTACGVQINCWVDLRLSRMESG